MKWIVDVKGSQGRSFEISVVLENNEHGIKSWGWFDENKLLISSSGSDNWGLTKRVWDKQIDLAHEVARELNRALDLRCAGKHLMNFKPDTYKI